MKAKSSGGEFRNDLVIFDKATTVVGEMSEVRKNELFNPARDEGLAAYQISILPGATIAPHFHVLDQFQVFVEGAGSFGAELLEPVTVHYSDRFSPYGPIKAGPAGLKFMVFRLQPDAGAFCMPESRAHLTQRPGRNVSAHMTRNAGKGRHALLEQPDGLAVTQVTLGVNEPLEEPSAKRSAHYALVIQGELRVDGELMPQKSCVFMSPDDGAINAVAGGAGCEVLLLQFPLRAWAAREAIRNAG